VKKEPIGKLSVTSLIWVFTTYFAEGLPYVLIRTLSTFFFRSGGASLEATGLTSLYGLPWILKFLWAPYLDTVGTKRSWLLITEAFLVFFFFLIGLLSSFAKALPIVALLFFVAAFFAASHDTAIDGYYLDALNAEEQVRFVGYRVMAYRVAMMFGSGVIVTIGTQLGWTWAFGLSALILSIIFGFHYFLLPYCELSGRPIKQFLKKTFSFPVIFLAVFSTIFFSWIAERQNSSDLFRLHRITFSDLVGIVLLFSLLLIVALRKKMLNSIRNYPDAVFSRAFLSFIDRDRITALIFFIISARMGEFMLSTMAGPFFIDVGLGKHYGWIIGAVGLPCSIIGAMIGGWLIAKKSLKKMIWPFLFAQNVTNLAYMVFAGYLQDSERLFASINVSVATEKTLLACGVVGFDYLAGGLGTAVLMTLLMELCRGDFKAAHFAIGTGLMSITGLYSGSVSGFLVKWFGYASFFGISFLFSLPAMGLIFFLPWQEMKR